MTDPMQHFLHSVYLPIYYSLAMITTLMPHLRIGPYKEGVIIDQIQMPFHAVGRSFPYELLIYRIHKYKG